MRGFFVVLLLVLGGYWFYQHRTSNDSLGDLAWRAVTRDESGRVVSIEVVAVSGKRWRTELTVPGRTKKYVMVSDGTTANSSHPGANIAALDPRPAMRLTLASTKRISPSAIEHAGGRKYLRGTEARDGLIAEVWADPETRFPLRVRGRAPGFLDVTYTPLPVKVLHETPGVFSTDALDPIFLAYANGR